MALAVRAGRRVVLVTCTRGEMGEIVVPEMDTPDNHRRLGEIRAGELERAMGALGVTEWENLGYKDSDMMGRAGNARRPELLAGGHRRGHRPARVPRPDLPAGRHDDLQRLRRLRPPRPHPDPPRRRSAPSRAPAIRRWYPEQLAPEHGGTGRGRRPRAGSRRGPRPSSTSRRSRPRSARRMQERMEAIGERSWWSPPEDATPEQIAEFEAFAAKMLVPDESITTLGRRPRCARRSAGRAIQAARDPDQRREPVRPLRQGGVGGVLDRTRRTSAASRGSRRRTQETDLFAGLEGREPGPTAGRRPAAGRRRPSGRP